MLVVRGSGTVRPGGERGPGCPGAAAFDSSVGVDIVAASLHERRRRRRRGLLLALDRLVIADKLPLLQSILITGWPWASALLTVCGCAQTADRGRDAGTPHASSGWPAVETPAPRAASPSVRSEISCPISTSASRSFARLLEVHRSGDSGSPRPDRLSRSRSLTRTGPPSDRPAPTTTNQAPAGSHRGARAADR